jgi:hypothetical protein
MLTDAAVKNLKPKDKPYKVTDRDGMYVRGGTNGTIAFRYDYRMHGRRETVTFGKYCASGLSLARAREKCIDAKRMIQEGLLREMNICCARGQPIMPRREIAGP